MGVSYHSGLLLRYSGGRELLLPLSATASLEHQVDRFGGNPVDVLVLSGWGVGWLTPGEGAGFLDIARDHGLDFQYATTGTALRDDEVHCSGGPVEQGRLAPEEGGSRRIVRSSSPLEEQLAAMEAQTEGLVFCPSHPAGLEMARRALSAPLIDRTDDLRTGVPGDGNLGFMRPDADLEVVFLVTDYYDESPMPADWYIDFLRSRKSEGRRARFHAIGVATEATDMPYAQVATATRGLVTPTGPSRPAVEEISKEIFRVERCLPLSDVPAEETIEVRKDGVVVQRQTPSGDAWTYDATANEICFREASRPEPGEGVEIRYQRPCLLP